MQSNVTPGVTAWGSRHFGPRTFGPQTVGPRGPIVRGPTVWVPTVRGPKCLEPNCHPFQTARKPQISFCVKCFKLLVSQSAIKACKKIMSASDIKIIQFGNVLRLLLTTINNISCGQAGCTNKSTWLNLIWIQVDGRLKDLIAKLSLSGPETLATLISFEN